MENHNNFALPHPLESRWLIVGLFFGVAGPWFSFLEFSKFVVIVFSLVRGYILFSLFSLPFLNNRIFLFAYSDKIFDWLIVVIYFLCCRLIWSFVPPIFSGGERRTV
jgi:hypothetical protein